MRRNKTVAVACFLVLAEIGAEAGTRAKKPPPASGWVHVNTHNVRLRATTKDEARTLFVPGRGSVLPLLSIQEKKGQRWFEVFAFSRPLPKPVRGWLPEKETELLPAESLPTNNDLLLELGGPFGDDEARESAVVARYLARLDGRELALVCLVALDFLASPVARIFRQQSGRWRLAAEGWQFTLRDPAGDLPALEVRDLVGDGRECLLSLERLEPRREVHSTRLVIRRLTGDRLEKVWDEPVEFSNLASFPARREIRRPAELNIGGPGTITRGRVSFLPAAAGRFDLEWEGQVELYQFGREAPTETLKLKKVCSWEGQRFKPLTNK